VHVEEGLEDNQDPSDLRDLRLSRLTVEGFSSEIISFNLVQTRLRNVRAMQPGWNAAGTALLRRGDFPA
jgi:hypothetical protein